jgi:hypothetical protein
MENGPHYITYLIILVIIFSRGHGSCKVAKQSGKCSQQVRDLRVGP